jgi:hypothetical protein
MTKETKRTDKDRAADSFVDGFLTPFRGIMQPSQVPHRKSSRGDLEGDWRAIGEDLRTSITALRQK